MSAAPRIDDNPKVIVLDSGALITGAKIDNFGADVQYWTIPEVIEEIKDRKTRHILESFPYEIKTRAISGECFKAGESRSSEAMTYPSSWK